MSFTISIQPKPWKDRDDRVNAIERENRALRRAFFQGKKYPTYAACLEALKRTPYLQRGDKLTIKRL